MHRKQMAQSQVSVEGSDRVPLTKQWTIYPVKWKQPHSPWLHCLLTAQWEVHVPPRQAGAAQGTVQAPAPMRRVLQGCSSGPCKTQQFSLCCSSLTWSCSPLYRLESWMQCKFYVAFAMNRDTLALCSACLPNNQPLGNWKLRTGS